jgi:hypothetical protein
MEVDTLAILVLILSFAKLYYEKSIKELDWAGIMSLYAPRRARLSGPNRIFLCTPINRGSCPAQFGSYLDYPILEVLMKGLIIV